MCSAPKVFATHNLLITFGSLGVSLWPARRRWGWPVVGAVIPQIRWSAQSSQGFHGTPVDSADHLSNAALPNSQARCFGELWCHSFEGVCLNSRHPNPRRVRKRGPQRRLRYHFAGHACRGKKVVFRLTAIAVLDEKGQHSNCFWLFLVQKQ